MSRIDEWDENERALYAVGSRALLDDLERQRREWNESYSLDSTSMDEINRTHSERMRELEDQQRAWLASFINGDADEGTQDVGPGLGASAPEPAPAPERGPGQPDPHEAELAEAERIRALPMTAWAEERQRLIRANRGLFSQETR